MDQESDKLITLNQQLRHKTSEMETMNKTIETLVNDKEIQMKDINQLREELKLLSAKLLLHENVVNCVTNSVATQTDLTLIDSQLNVCINCQKPMNSSNDWRQNSQNKNTKISDLVRETAQEVVANNDYVYDEKSKTYYSRSTGWYYYPESYLFYDPNSENYYKYDSDKKEYIFYSSLNQKNDKKDVLKAPKAKKIKKDLQTEDTKLEVIYVSSEEEEGEILDSEDSSDDNSDDSNNVKLSPPLVRMIVKQSSTLDIGSLLLVTCMGAKIGNEANCDVWITDETVSRTHAEIKYDYKLNNYMMKDLNSTNGTFINGEKLETNTEMIVKHSDEITFGECVLLVHIHYGKDVTCDRCEPGLVMANLKSDQQNNCNNYYEVTDKEKDHKKQLKLLKKKYGLKNVDYCEQKVSVIVNTNYKDRAEMRRIEKGSDNPYEKTAAGTSLDTALSKSNKGFQMLQKMGWKRGKALGKHENGIIEPVNVITNNSNGQSLHKNDI
ncbi:angiogenic factor with G patch and FHA domains 1-like [Oppia nitens]|uniref:angiogenic factor with G patch and FHA domains 1-like n=1 Tax=Oppia nitens TaxID=1686743 RepID=UPI0023DBF254|nr:angiogenic factor with G patch and FHA domains 1-like [Oppia nitens]